jgi:hypothetical protein
MTTTTQGKETTGVDVEKLLELEHVDIHKALGIPPVPPTAEGARVRPWRRFVAVGVLAGVAGLAAGYGVAAWSYGQDISALERQASLTTTVPFGGFQSEYGAVREHVALADNLSAGGAQGSWASAPGGSRTFLMYPGSGLEVVYGPSSNG